MKAKKVKATLVSVQRCPCGCTHVVHTRAIVGTAKGLVQCREYFRAMGSLGLRACPDCGVALQKFVMLVPQKKDR